MLEIGFAYTFWGRKNMQQKKDCAKLPRTKEKERRKKKYQVVKKRRKERERKKERKKRKIHQTTPPEKANHLLPLTPNTLLRSVPSYQKPNTFPVFLPPKTRLLYLKPSPKLSSTNVSK
jgi:hypothetical protein